MKVLYLVGEIPPDLRASAEYVIFQNIYPPDPWYEADLVLPAAAFSEIDGTFVNGEGRIQRVRRAASPPGGSLPDWEIFCRIARKMGKKGFDFSSVSKIRREISSLLKGLGDTQGTRRRPRSLVCEGRFATPAARPKAANRKDRRFPLFLNTSVVEHTYRGFPLSRWVEGARKLFADGVVEISPSDARKAKISEGDRVVVTSARFERTWPAKITSQQPEGTLRVTLRPGESVGFNPHPVRIRKKRCSS